MMLRLGMRRPTLQRTSFFVLNLAIVALQRLQYRSLSRARGESLCGRYLHVRQRNQLRRLG